MWSGGTPFTAAGFLKGATGGAWLGSTGVVNPTHPFWVSLAGNASLMTIVDDARRLRRVRNWRGSDPRTGDPLRRRVRRPPDDPPVRRQLELRDRSLNEQLMYGLIAGTIAYVGAGAYALDSVVEKLAIMQRIPVVKYALG